MSRRPRFVSVAAAPAVASDSDEGTPEALERDRCNRETVFQRRRDVNARVTASIGERLRDGDESALEESYRRLGPLVRAYVQRFVPRDDAEDIVQITFLELWRARKRYDPSRSLEGFVFGIARDRSIDHLRRRRHDVVDVDHLRNLIGDDGRELVERLVWAAEVRGALGELPEVRARSARDVVLRPPHAARDRPPARSADRDRQGPNGTGHAASCNIDWRS